MVRVIIVDDRVLVREALRRLVSSMSKTQVVGEASSLTEAIKVSKQQGPTAALVDVAVAAGDGDLAKLASYTTVVVLNARSDKHLYALRDSVGAIVSREGGGSDLEHALHAAAAGKSFYSADIAPLFADRDGGRAPVQVANALSKREFEVMCFLAGGMTNREIAKKLGISVKTIDTHRGHLLKKLQLRNNSDITRFALKNGFLRM